MAAVKIVGECIVVTSTIARADLELAEKRRSSALEIRDPDSGDLMFKVGTGSSSLSDHGICFSGVSDCEGKFAVATIQMQWPPDVGDKADYVVQNYGHALAQLLAVEDAFAGKIDQIRSQQNRVKGIISVV